MPRDKVYYEWDVEVWGPESERTADLPYHNHTTSYELALADLATYEPEDNAVVVLVRDTGNEEEGLKDRSWYYPRTGTGMFTDAAGNFVSSVPKVFMKQIAAVHKNRGEVTPMPGLVDPPVSEFRLWLSRVESTIG